MTHARNFAVATLLAAMAATATAAPLQTMTVPQPISPASIRKELKSILKMLDNE